MTNTSEENRTQRSARSHYGLAIAALLFVGALLAGIGLTWSAYTGGAYLKGVEVTNATQSLFASDMLVGYYSDPIAKGSTTQLDSRSVVVSTSGDTCSFTFRIYNCLLDDKQVVNDKDVPYTLSVTADGLAKGETWSISPSDELDQKVTLQGNNATVKEYTITFPKSALGNVSFMVKAAVDTAQSNIGTKLACLAAKIVPNAPSTVEAASVTGLMVDKTDSNKPADFAGINYRITVTGLETKVKLSWKNDYIELDPFFSDKYSGASVDSKNGTATFTLEPGSTVVNFYRVSAVSSLSWDNLGINVEQA